MLKYVESRNITLNLPVPLIRKAKVYAAQHDTTINALVRELLDEKLSSQERIRAAAAKFLEIARKGPHSNVDPGSISRDEIHERW
jgi:plasmid stability protein